MPKNLYSVYEDVSLELADTFRRKNSDYGSAVDITFLMLGEKAQLVRLWDKLLRLTRLTLADSQEVESESKEDTLSDLANYAIIALAQRRLYKEDKDTQLGKVFKEFVFPGKEEE